MLEVESDAVLVAVHAEEIDALVVEERRHAAREVAAAGHLDLDHLGAERAQHPRAIGPREHVREVEHAQRGERTGSIGYGCLRHLCVMLIHRGTPVCAWRKMLRDLPENP